VKRTLILASILLATVGSPALAQSTAGKTGVNSAAEPKKRAFHALEPVGLSFSQ